MASNAPSEGAAAASAGIGGKFRSRPFRRAAATPYDRPASALRGARALAERRGGGWLAKLVDPASRAITSGASRLFSSVLGRRPPPALPDAAAVPETCLQSSEVIEADHVVANNLSSAVREQEMSAGDKAMNNSETGGISDLEQLLKQKTFTRAEFDRLMEVLHSRTIESSSSEPAVNYKDEDTANVSLQKTGVGSSRLYGNVSTHEGLLNDAASPAEIAKAFMGSRPSKVSPSSLCLRSEVLQEEATVRGSVPYAAKASDLSVPPHSIVRFSGISDQPENCYVTPRTQGRSAIYKMSRSPYFRAQSTSNIKGGVPAWDGPSTSSQWTPTSNLKGGVPAWDGFFTSSQWPPTPAANSGGKQVLKRQSSVLDNDIISSGPLRRIRHKSNFITPMKDLQSSVSVSLLPSPLTSLSKDGMYGSTSLIQKPVLYDAKKYGTVLKNAENGDDKDSYATVVPIPPQSSEMARKILQQLDKLVPSPKEKSSEPKAILRNESSSKSTLDKLHGHTLRSMVDVDSSNEQIISQKQEKVEENGRMVLPVSGVNMAPEAGGRKNAVTSGYASKFVTRMSDIVISGSGVVSRKEPALQTNVLEGLRERDDDGSSSKGICGPSTTLHNKDKPGILDSKSDIFDSVSKESQVHSFLSLPSSSHILQKNVHKKATDGPVLAEKADFSFPSIPATMYSQPPPTPTLQAQLLDRSNLQEQPAAPVFTFGSKDVPGLKFSSSISGVAASAGPKFGLRSTLQEQTAAPVFAFGSKDVPRLKFLSCITGVGVSAGLKFGLSNSFTAAVPESPNPDGGDLTQKTLDIANASLGKSTSTKPPVFTFGASTTSTLSNGLLKSTSAVFSHSTAPFNMSSHTATGATFSSITMAASSQSSTISSLAPVSSTFPMIQFGSGSSAGASTSVSPTLNKSDSNNKSDSKELEEKPVNASPFSFSWNTGQIGSISSSPTFGLSTSSSFAFGSSSAASSAPFGNSPSSSSVFSSFAGAGSSSSSTGSSVQAAVPSLFSSSSQPSTLLRFGSAYGASTSLPSTGFSFGSSTPSGSSLTFGSTPGPGFSFSSHVSATSSLSSSPAPPILGMSTPATGFSSGSQGNDQMNVEDSIANDNTQDTIHAVPVSNSSAMSNSMFSSPGQPAFQFSSHQNSSPFQTGGGLEFSASGGSVSLGTGGADKSGRRFVKVRRDKHRKKQI